MTERRPMCGKSLFVAQAKIQSRSRTVSAAGD
jgi:hypothetical protein